MVEPGRTELMQYVRTYIYKKCAGTSTRMELNYIIGQLVKRHKHNDRIICLLLYLLVR